MDEIAALCMEKSPDLFDCFLLPFRGCLPGFSGVVGHFFPVESPSTITGSGRL